MTTGAPRQLGPFETDSRASKPDWLRGFSIKTGTRPLSHVAAWVGGGKKAFEVERAVLRKLCHVVLKSGALIGPHGTVDAHFRRIPAVIG